MARPIRKLIQLILDKRAAAKTEADAKKALGGVDRALGGLKKRALAFGATLAAAFATRGIIRFGKDAIKVATDAERIWSKLAQAIENTGVNAEDAIPEVKEFSRAFQDVTTLGDEDFAEVMTELLTTSNDYAGSLENVGLALDLATAKSIDLRTAAQMVGRAMVGETGTFKRYGIIIEEGADAIEVLRKQFKGFAAKEAKTLHGWVLRLKNEFSDLKQVIGEVLIEMGQGASLMEALTWQVKDLTLWIEENKRGIVEWGRIFILTLKAVGGTFVELFRLAWNTGNTIGSLITWLVAKGEEEAAAFVHQLSTIMNALIAGMNAVPGVNIPFLINGADPAEFEKNSAAALASLKANAREAGGAIDRFVQNWVDLAVAVEQFGTAGSVRGREGRGTGGPVAPPPVVPGGGQAEQMFEDLEDAWAKIPGLMVAITASMHENEQQTENLANGWANLNSEMAMSPANAAKLAEQIENVARVSSMTKAELLQVGAVAGAVGTLMAGAFGSGIGEIAAFKAKQNAILAAEQGVQGLVSSLNPLTAWKAPLHYKAALEFAGIAAAWGTLAGATGGFSSGGGGGGGRGSPRDPGGEASERTETPGPEVHIHLVGPGFSATNPEVQRIVYGAQQNAIERFGPNSKVILHRRSKP
jgi:hypothetical protein